LVGKEKKKATEDEDLMMLDWCCRGFEMEQGVVDEFKQNTRML